MIGKILGGRYEILEKIGSGGMSVVYRAHCLKLNRDVAVKVLRNDLDNSDDFIKRFNVEAQAAASLTHPNIVSVYDVGSEADTHYIVMELVTGVTLKEYVRSKTVLKWQEALKITQKIASALEEAHLKHIVHRDIKPQNIIVTTEGNIKVTDFGIAKAATTSTVSIDSDVLGSVHYISPEQARGGYVDEKSDIYSLGIVMYEMLTGKVPFEGETPVAVAMKHIEEPPVSPTSLNADIPEGIEAIVLKAMSKETRYRYQTIGEMKSDLDIASNDPNAVYIPENIPDDAPTQKVPTLRTKEVILNLGPNNPEFTDASVKRERNKSGKKLSSKDKKTILLAVIASVLIVFCGSMFVANALYGFSIFSFSNGEELVPNLVGMTVDEANDELKGTRFTLVEGEKRASSEYDEGVIIEQNPKAKRTVKDNTEITVVISAGSKEITLDDYTGEEYRSIELELEQLDLDVKIVFEQDEEIEENHIIKQSPVAGKKIKTGGTVTLYVSEGNHEGEVTVPNLIGKSESDAKKLLQDADLILGEVSTEKSSKDKGTVIRQSVVGGDFVAKNTKVDVVISGGDNEGVTSQKEKTLTISLPQEKEQIELKIIANSKTVYQGTVYPSKTPEFTRKFKGSSVVKFDIYMDGTLVGSKTIDFSE